MDWNNVDRFAAEIPLDADSIIISDPDKGDIPVTLTCHGAKVVQAPIGKLAKK